MRSIQILIGFFFFFCLSGLNAQSSSCITGELDQIENRLSRNQQAGFAGFAESSAIQYVPIAFHAVGNSDGSDRISEVQLLDMMCILNDKYQDQQIQFHLTNPPIHYLDDNGINNQPGAFTAALRNARIPNAINVFITNNINNIIGAAGYYQSPAGFDGNDFIVIARPFVYAQNVFPHEIGHFFSLLHPFHGWENNAWSEAVHGNPVGMTAPSDPGLFPTPIANELANGSNCSTAGDRICDTPPDYLFAQHPTQNGCAEWILPVRDSNNMVVDPQENNIMSYFGNCGNYVFTSDQKDAIRNDLLNAPERGYIRQSTVPNMTPINSVPELIFPAQGSTVASAEQTTLAWFPVQGAQYYVTEIDISPGFSSPFRQSKVVAASVPNAVFENLQGESDYYWRVRPFTEYTTCTGYSDRGEFKTPISTAVQEISGLHQFHVYPNPVIAGEEMTLQVGSDRGFQGQLLLYNTAGQLVLNRSLAIRAREQRLGISIPNVIGGIYFLVLKNNKGQRSLRLVVRHSPGG